MINGSQFQISLYYDNTYTFPFSWKLIIHIFSQNYPVDNITANYYL